MRRYAWMLVVLALLALWTWQQRTPAVAPAPSASSQPAAQPQSQWPARAGQAGAAVEADRWPAWLPAEAVATLELIERGGPFPHRQDGAVFQNRERLLPGQPLGYYHEYTVATPGARDRGARRIVSGGDPTLEYYYSDDHYRSFRRIDAHGGPR